MPWLLIGILSVIATAAILGYYAIEAIRLRAHLKRARTTYDSRAQALLATALVERRNIGSPTGEQYVVGVHDTLLGRMLIWVRISLWPDQTCVAVECSSSCPGAVCEIADRMHNAFSAAGTDVSIIWNMPQPLAQHYILPSERRKK